MFSESDGYEQFMGRWSRRLAPSFIEFAGVSEGDHVLDVGCGTGALSFAAAAVKGVEVVGVDRSPEFVQAAGRAGVDRTTFQVGDACALPMPDGEFDRSLSMLVVNFLPDAAAGVREMNRVTRFNGVVAGAVWDYGDGMQMLRAFWDGAVALDPAAASRDERHMSLCRRGELSALWRDVGLDDVDEAALTIEMEFASFDDYWQPFLAGQGPAGAYVSTLARSGRDRLRARLDDRLTDSSRARFSLSARAWAVRGVVT